MVPKVGTRASIDKASEGRSQKPKLGSFSAIGVLQIRVQMTVYLWILSKSFSPV